MTDREKAAFLAAIMFHDQFADDYRNHQTLDSASAAVGFSDRPHNPGCSTRL
jgi:hypothetical protein